MKIFTDNNVIHIETDITLPVNKTWEILTGKEHITNWWGSHVSLEAELGGKLIEKWSDGSREITTSGEVMKCNPPHILEMTWADDDWTENTKVTFSLSENKNGTKLILEHSGWDIHPDDKRQELIGAHTEGWSHYIITFADYAKSLS